MSENNATIGRNEPCPCGSGKKYKRCCGVAAAPKLSIPNPASGKPGFGPTGGPGSGFDPKMLENFDPQMMMQMTQAIQRLPHGQLQKLQNMMQRAMSGQDVTSEAEEFEKALPQDFKNVMASFGSALGGPEGAGEGSGGQIEGLPADFLAGSHPAQLSNPLNMPARPDISEGPDAATPPMSEAQARQLVEEAAKAGVISKEQAEELLKFQQQPQPAPKAPDDASDDAPDDSIGKSGGESESEQGPGLTQEEDKGLGIGKFWRNRAGKK